MRVGTEQLRLEQIYLSYRIVLALLLCFLMLLTMPDPVLGGVSPIPYAFTVIGYFGFSLLAYTLVRFWRSHFDWLMGVGFLVDLATLTLISDLNMGPSLQLSMLYLVTVVAAHLILVRKNAIMIMLFAVICVAYQQFYYSLSQSVSSKNLASMLLLISSFVSVSVFASVLAGRVKLAENLAGVASERARELETIGREVVESMKDGALVFGERAQIVFCNRAARSLFGLAGTQPGRLLSELDHEFFDQLASAMAKAQPEFIFTPRASRLVEPMAVRIVPLSGQTTLIILERLSDAATRAQQLKLSSLGRLTASIAHEIRNPLAAISQASELLLEDQDSENAPLLSMIRQQTKRVNQIIEDILKLSKNSSAEQSKIELGEFFNKLNTQYFAETQVYMQAAKGTQIWFNPSQLEQVLVNLINNAKAHGAGRVSLIASNTPEGVIIDVTDQGAGIEADEQDKLFEPFYTTSKKGTGLGLYLSRMFCEANGARISYIAMQSGSCFRIMKEHQLDEQHANFV